MTAPGFAARRCATPRAHSRAGAHRSWARCTCCCGPTAWRAHQWPRPLGARPIRTINHDFRRISLASSEPDHLSSHRARSFGRLSARMRGRLIGHHHDRHQVAKARLILFVAPTFQWPLKGRVNLLRPQSACDFWPALSAAKQTGAPGKLGPTRNACRWAKTKLSRSIRRPRACEKLLGFCSGPVRPTCVKLGRRDALGWARIRRRRRRSQTTLVAPDLPLIERPRCE